MNVIRDLRYGPAERNFLDVFVPHGDETNRPVIMYVHGGGFISGDKMWTEKVYSNIGWFFAERGIITVVINHRLVPHVKYPGGAEDIQMAREWIYNHIYSPQYGRGSPEKVVLFGHSSGGAHIAMNLYAAGNAYINATDHVSHNNLIFRRTGKGFQSFNISSSGWRDLS